jgi:hypothetical protein
MSKRVDEREWLEYQWPYLMKLLGGEERISQLAYETGAFSRKRKIASPSDLLRLLLMWSAGEHSLGETAALAAAGDLTDVSDVALLKRFTKCGPWVLSLLTTIVGQARRHADLTGRRLRLIDATIVASAGKGRHNDHRIHVGYNASSGGIDHIELSSMKGGEDLTRFDFEPSDVVIADRGYGRERGIRKVVDAGARFIVRISWQNLPLVSEDGTPFDILAALRAIEEARSAESRVRLRGDPTNRVYRFVAIRKSEPAAAESRRKLQISGRKDRRTLDLRTLEVAGYTFVLTNLEASFTAEQVLELYRLRWQVEICFKSLKSIIELDRLPVRSFELAQTYLAAKLLVAVLIEQLVFKYDSFSPWGYPLAPAATRLETDPASA